MIKAIHTRLDQREEGFTLIELLVVVIIIGILAAVAIPVFLNQRQRAYRAAMQSDLRNAAVEIETFFTDANTYVGFDITTYRESAGVTLALDDAQATTYCVTASHTSSSEKWNILPGNDLGMTVDADGAATARAACP